MKANRSESLDLCEEFTPSESCPSSATGMPQVVESLKVDLRPWSCDDVSHTIWLLSMIANDERVCAQDPARVIEAFQNHGHLLCDHEVESLKDWLVRLDRSGVRGAALQPA